jgi:hypothetical protein
LATDWGRVSSTASPSAVETDLEVFLKRRQWVVIKKPAVSRQRSALRQCSGLLAVSLVFAQGCRHKVAEAHRHKAENGLVSKMTLSLCLSVPLSLKLSAKSTAIYFAFAFSSSARFTSASIKETSAGPFIKLPNSSSRFEASMTRIHPFP